MKHEEVAVDPDQEHAPGRLAIIEEFVNTYDIESHVDELPDVTVLGRWLSAHGLLEKGERITDPDDHARASRLREALRQALLANHEREAPPPQAAAVLEEEAARAPVVIDVSGRGAPGLRPTVAGLDGAIARMLAIVHEAMQDGTWQRMKACRSDTCQYAFYDASRNRSGKWCSMRVCGNRAKVRAFRERQEMRDA